MGNETRLNRIERKLDATAPAEPLIVRFVWIDPWPDGEVVAEQVVDYSGPVIQLRWPEDEDGEKRRATMPQDARSS